MNYPVYIDVTESKKIEIPLREVKRYLGYGRVEMTPEVAEIARELVDETRKIMRPRACYTRLAVNFMDYPRMDLGFGIVESKNLWQNLSDGSLFDFAAPAGAAPLKQPVSDISDSSGYATSDVSGSFRHVTSDASGSSGHAISDTSGSSGHAISDTSGSSGHAISDTSGSSGHAISDTSGSSGHTISDARARECFLLAATIGPQMDVQIRKFARTSPSKSVILQAVGAAAIEAYCDLLEERMSAEVADEGLTLLPRFSPGYGDFSLQHQLDFFRVLDPPRRAGITLTDRLLMVPEKSVTAVIGLTKADAGTICPQDREASKDRCETCSNISCGYRTC